MNAEARILHQPGCRSRACDKRVEVHWGRTHPRAHAASSNLADVPGVPYSFAACVALRESTDGQGSPDIYGILPMNGYFSGMSLAEQKGLFSRMYARDGTSPWSPWDGC